MAEVPNEMKKTKTEEARERERERWEQRERWKTDDSLTLTLTNVSICPAPLFPVPCFTLLCCLRFILRFRAAAVPAVADEQCEGGCHIATLTGATWLSGCLSRLLLLQRALVVVVVLLLLLPLCDELNWLFLLRPRCCCCCCCSSADFHFLDKFSVPFVPDAARRQAPDIACAKWEDGGRWNYIVGG